MNEKQCQKLTSQWRAVPHWLAVDKTLGCCTMTDGDEIRKSPPQPRIAPPARSRDTTPKRRQSPLSSPVSFSFLPFFFPLRSPVRSKKATVNNSTPLRRFFSPPVRLDTTSLYTCRHNWLVGGKLVRFLFYFFLEPVGKSLIDTKGVQYICHIARTQ